MLIEPISLANSSYYYRLEQELIYLGTEKIVALNLSAMWQEVEEYQNMSVCATCGHPSDHYQKLANAKRAVVLEVMRSHKLL